MCKSYEDAVKMLGEQGQEHVLKFWERLGAAERESLLRQVSELDISALARMRELLAGDSGPAAGHAELVPAPVVDPGGEEKAIPEPRRGGIYQPRATPWVPGAPMNLSPPEAGGI